MQEGLSVVRYPLRIFSVFVFIYLIIPLYIYRIYKLYHIFIFQNQKNKDFISFFIIMIVQVVYKYTCLLQSRQSKF